MSDVLKARLAQGDRVRVRLAGHMWAGLGFTAHEWADGLIVLASAGDPQSVMVQLTGMVRTATGGVAGGYLPLTINYEAVTAKALWGDEYEIEVAG